MNKRIIGTSVLLAIAGCFLYAETDYPSREKVETRRLEVKGRNAQVIIQASQTITGDVTLTGDTTQTGDITVTGDVSVDGGVQNVSETLTLTKGNFLLTPTQNVYFVAGQYGVVTMSLAAASVEMEVEIINLVATNVVFDQSTGLVLPTSGTSVTNGVSDVIRFRSQGTNWICNGYIDN